MPEMAYQLLRAELASQADMEIVGQRSSRASLLRDFATTGADVVILELDRTEEPGACRESPCEPKSLTTVGLSSDQRRAFLFELRVRGTALGQTSPAELVAAIRAACITE
jgi:DNA-binding NarL/FixJ family response regulator